MELSRALETLKSVCDDAVSNGRFKNIDDVGAVIESYNTVVSACNFAVQSNTVVKQETQTQPNSNTESGNLTGNEQKPDDVIPANAESYVPETVNNSTNTENSTVPEPQSTSSDEDVSVSKPVPVSPIESEQPAQ